MQIVGSILIYSYIFAPGVPAVVAWFVKASVFHSVNYAPSANGGSNPALGMV